MICYKDKWWCNKYQSCVNGQDCDRAFNEKVLGDAVKWWGKSEGIPVDFQENPDCYKENKPIENIKE